MQNANSEKKQLEFSASARLHGPHFGFGSPRLYKRKGHSSCCRDAATTAASPSSTPPSYGPYTNEANSSG